MSCRTFNFANSRFRKLEFKPVGETDSLTAILTVHVFINSRFPQISLICDLDLCVNAAGDYQCSYFPETEAKGALDRIELFRFLFKELSVGTEIHRQVHHRQSPKVFCF